MEFTLGGVPYAHTPRVPVPHLELDGDNVAMLAERATGQQAKRTGNKYTGLPCPFTEHANPKPSDFVIMAGGGGNCIKCGKGISAVQLIARYRRCSTEDALSWMREQLHLPRWQTRRPPARPPAEPIAAATSLDPSIVDAIYRDMVHLLGLSDTHAAYDPKRSQTAEEMQHLGYATLPPDEGGKAGKRAEVAGKLAVKYGEAQLAAVPGFYRQRPGDYWTICGSAGILLPTRDIEGRITRFQLGADAPKPGDNKYKWLASPVTCRRCHKKCTQLDNHPEHTRLYPHTPAAAHVAVPPTPQDTRIWITEGPRKADIAAARIGAVVIAAPGAGVQKPVIAALNQLGEGEHPRVVLAFDRDRAGKEATAKLAANLAALGHVVEVASWDSEAAKGVDDALLGAVPVTTAYHVGKGLGAIDAEVMSELYAAAQPPHVYSLAEAREGNYEAVKAVLDRFADGYAGSGRVTMLTSTTGTGKTYAARRALADRQKQGWPTVKRRRHSRRADEDYTEYRPLRVAIVVDKREQVLEWVTELAKLGLPAAPLVGRVQWHDEPTAQQAELMRLYEFALCEHADQANIYAANNHSTAYVCGPKAEPHKCNVAAMHRAAGITPPTGGQEDEPTAQVVVATKDALLTVADRVDCFNLIIGDEGIEAQLYEETSIDAASRKAWLRGIERNSELYPDGCAQRVLWGLLADVVERNEGQTPLLAALRRHATDTGLDLTAILAECAAEKAANRRDCLALEEPLMWAESGKNEEVIPPRRWQIMCADLAEQLQRGDEPAEFAARWWLLGRNIVCRVEREHLIHRLTPGPNRLDAIVLDATPGPVMGQLLPHAERVDFQVREHLVVTQITDALYGAGGMATRHANAAHRLAAVAEMLAGSTATSAVIGHKRFMGKGGAIIAQLDAVEGAEAGWYGNHDKAHNDWQQVNRLIIIGHYQHPPEVTARAAAMVRRATGVTYTPSEVQGGRVLRPYLWQDPNDGTGHGWWCYVGGDALADAIAHHSEQATIRQAIGRARATLRPATEPVEVYLLTATPVADLRIDRLCKLADLEAEGGCTDPNATHRANAALTKLNEERKAEARAKLEAAWADGVRGVRALSRATGASFPTVQKFLADQRREQSGAVFNGVIDTPVNISIITMSKTPTNISTSTAATVLYSTWLDPTAGPPAYAPPVSSPQPLFCSPKSSSTAVLR